MRKKLLFVSVTIVALAALSTFHATTKVRGVAAAPETVNDQRESGPTGLRIEGRVLDADGLGVPGAMVFAERDDVLQKRLPFGRSGAGGEYVINVDSPGMYTVYGSKDSDDYPLTISAFHTESPLIIPTVSVSQNQVVSNVIVQFGPRASKLSGNIVDSSTNRPVVGSTITLRRADNPNASYIVGANEDVEHGRFKVLVPTIPFTMEVNAPGYEGWKYTNGSPDQRPSTIRLKRGEMKSLTVALQPKR